MTGPPRYKVLGSSVNVLGVGGDVVDDEVTSTPQLVLVKPAVNVLTKGRFRLLNPNGWYCFETAVIVLAKSEIIAHCNAHLTSSVQSVAVAGGNAGTDGVTVLGKAVVKRIGCEGDSTEAVHRIVSSRSSTKGCLASALAPGEPTTNLDARQTTGVRRETALTRHSPEVVWPRCSDRPSPA